MEKPFQMIILGNSNVGKTSFVRDTLQNNNESTIGVDFSLKIITLPNEQEKIKIQFWDTAGQELYHSISRNYYRKSECAILMFELNNLKSWNQVKSWFYELHEHDPTIGIILAGSKCDLINDFTQAEILLWSNIWNEAREFSEKYNLKLIAISNYTGEGKKECIYESVRLIRKRRKNEVIYTFENNLKEPFFLTENKKSVRERCC